MVVVLDCSVEVEATTDAKGGTFHEGQLKSFDDVARMMIVSEQGAPSPEHMHFLKLFVQQIACEKGLQVVTANINKLSTDVLQTGKAAPDDSPPN
jgi:hypothetical protein